MKELRDYILESTDPARLALQKINDLAIPAIAVFVTDKQGKVVGTVTDGDIRRGLLKGIGIENPISEFMHTGFKYIVQGSDNFDRIKEFRSRNIRFVPVLDSNMHLVEVIDLEATYAVLPVSAVLMAGGKGERLRPLTNDLPKPLLEVGGIPIIERNIDRLRVFGVRDFYVSVNYMADKIINKLGDGSSKQVRINYIREEKPLGTVGAARLVTDYPYDTILLMNSDLLTNISFDDFYIKFKNSGADMAVATMPYYVDVPYAIMDIADDDKVRSFKEKPRFSYYSNAGIYLFKKELLDLIPYNAPFDATALMEKVIAMGKTLISYPILGYWLDIGRMEDFYKAQEDVKHIRF